MTEHLYGRNHLGALMKPLTVSSGFVGSRQEATDLLVTAAVSLQTLIVRFFLPTNSQLGGGLSSKCRPPPPPPDLLFALSPSLHGRAAIFVETFHSKHNAGSIIVVTVNDAVSLAANPQPEGARRLVSVTLTAPFVLSPAVFSGSSRRCCGSGDSLTGSTQTEIGTGRGHEMAFGTFSFLPASRQYPPPPLPPPDCCQGNTRRGSGEMQCTCAVELSPQSNIFFLQQSVPRAIYRFELIIIKVVHTLHDNKSFQLDLRWNAEKKI